MQIKTAIFDMDGTLVDSLGYWDILWELLSEKYMEGRPFTPNEADAKAVRTLPLDGAMALIHANYKIGGSAQEIHSVAENLLWEHYEKNVKPKAGVREFLEACRKQGTKMCVASASSREMVQFALKHCGLDPYFSVIFTCAEVGKGKEHPDVYRLAQDWLGSRTEDTWVVEDSVTALKTAVGIGMPTIGVYDRYNPYQDLIRQVSTVYVAEGETLCKLLG